MRTFVDVRCPQVVGRVAELAAIDAVITDGGVVVIEGEPGVGKSRLAAAAAERARAAGMAVVSGRATAGAAAAFRPLAEVLMVLSRDGGPTDASVLARHRGILSRLVPAWSEPLVPGAGDPSLIAVAEAFARVLRAAAGSHGIFVVLEDLHWADPETLEVAHYLADNIAGARVVVLVTLRPVPVAAAQLAEGLAARGAAAHLQLDALSPDQVRAMTAACLGGDEIPAAVLELVAAAEGLPLVVEDLLATAVRTGALRRDDGQWAVSGPMTAAPSRRFADTVRARVALLSPPAVDILRAAAVLGRTFDWRHLAAITGHSEDTVLSGLRDALEMQLIVAESGGRADAFAFRHALTRDAVAADVLAPQRALLSRRAAEVVEGYLAPADQAGWMLAAQLRTDAGDSARAGELLLAGGRAALQQGALGSAEQLLRRGWSTAPEGPTAAETGLLLVEVLALAGNSAAALELAGQVTALTANWPADRRADVHLALARAALDAERFADTRHQLDLAGRHASLAAAARKAVLEARLALASASGDRFVAAEHLAAGAVAAAQVAGLPDVECEALEIIGRCARVRDLSSAEKAFGRAYEVAQAAGLAVWRVRALNELGTIDMFRDADAARLDSARSEAYGMGAVATAAGIDVNLAALYTMRHELDTALAAADRCEELARRYRLPVRAAGVLFQGVIACHQGRFRDMSRHVRTAEDLAGDDPDILIGTWAMCRAMRSLLREERQSAAGEFAAAARAAAGSPALAINPATGPRLLVRAVDQQVTAVELDSFDAGNAVGSRWSALWGGLARAVVRGSCGDSDGAAAAYSTAVSAGDRLPLFCYLGIRLAGEAAVRDGWGDPATGLTGAERFFTAAGHEPVAIACRSLLRRAGGPRQRQIDAAVHPQLRRLGVTAREAEVLALVGERLTNRDIATRLYLSPRTVEKHVASVLTKSGVGSRGDLVQLATSLGLTG